jgi:hypothetical protein
MFKCEWSSCLDIKLPFSSVTKHYNHSSHRQVWEITVYLFSIASSSSLSAHLWGVFWCITGQFFVSCELFQAELGAASPQPSSKYRATAHSSPSSIAPPPPLREGTPEWKWRESLDASRLHRHVEVMLILCLASATTHMTNLHLTVRVCNRLITCFPLSLHVLSAGNDHWKFHQANICGELPVIMARKLLLIYHSVSSHRVP